MPAAEERRTCTRCVMDTSDPEIVFDAAGVCHHCHAYDQRLAALPASAEAGQRRLQAMVERLRADARGRPYDCVIGLSGGVDSSFVALLLVRELGLRPLAVHLDNGWDTEIAVHNIERLVAALDLDLHTVVLDWPSFADLQRAFLLASVPDCEVPTDHAIIAALFATARRFRIRHVVLGTNLRTESHLPRAWSRGHGDWRYIASVHRRHGSMPLRDFPHQDLWRLAWNRWRLRVHEPLDWIAYRKAAAKQRLISEIGWGDYGGKHHESIYTRWYQGCYLPRKFGFDKRRAHCSSLICSGELTRAEALRQLAEPPYDPELQAADTRYVARKLGLSEAQMQEIWRAPPRRFADYPSYAGSWWYRCWRWLRHRR
ncbi:MAG: N-acetyl sugar amidotransferase [Planctomycetota bacterium]|nr:N-acetyl sugar amidotransferase [Planctomycetota bacterium]